VIQSPGFVLKRTDPATDPGDYRVVFLFDLAERHYGIPGLKDRILQVDDNESQYLTNLDVLKDGATDAIVTYLSNAVGNDLPYFTLPDEVDLSNTTMTDWYRTSSYTNPKGQTFRGSPMVYGAAIPTSVKNQPGAEAFIRGNSSGSHAGGVER
jgi:molybdate/tungstate transport system substrate-binding protein